MTPPLGSGQAPAVDVVPVGDAWSMLVGDGPCRRSYEVTFGPQAGATLTVFVNGTPVTVELPERRGLRAGRAGSIRADNTVGPALVAAPMPGRVVKVLVQAGDTVAARQGLLVIEAMKMENELRAPRAGTVKEVRVAQGALVEAGNIVVVLES